MKNYVTVLSPPCPKCKKRLRGRRYGTEATVRYPDGVCCDYRGPIVGEYVILTKEQQT